MDDELIKRVAVASARANRAQQALNTAHEELGAAWAELREAQEALDGHQNARIKAAMAELGDK